MTSDTHLAFATLAERAAAFGGPLDRISLRDHIVDVEIGAFQAERGTSQRVRFNIVVEVLPVENDIDDDVDRILSYDRIVESIAEALGETRLNLLETLADRVAELILLSPQAVRTFVRIEKLDRGPGALGVEIVRDRNSVPKVDENKFLLHPRLVYLSNAAITSPHLAAWIDELEAQECPIILCVGAGDLPVSQTGHRMTQRRIDLLAIDQNAWCLAARDDRCVVVNTRTELDWAMKNDRISVWAPSKIVLDAVETPSVQPSDTVALTQWFATQIAAKDMVIVGAPKLEQLDSAIPIVELPSETATLL